MGTDCRLSRMPALAALRGHCRRSAARPIPGSFGDRGRRPALDGGSVLLLAFLPGGLRATALQRMLVHALLSFVAVYVVLSYYGWDLRAVLTTSAIVTAAIGFAMQPTLGSVISGVVLNMDYRLRVGDGIIRGGEAIEIESLGWRNVVGRKSNGQLVYSPMRGWPTRRLSSCRPVGRCAARHP